MDHQDVHKTPCSIPVTCLGTIPQLMGFRTCRAGWELQNLSWKEALTAHGRPSKWRSDWQNTSKQFGYTTKVGCKIVSWEPFCTVSCSMSFCLSFSFSFSLSFFFSLSLSLSVLFQHHPQKPTLLYVCLEFEFRMISTLLGSWNQRRDGPDHQGIGTHQCDILRLAVHILWAERSTFQIWAWGLSQATVLNSGVPGNVNQDILSGGGHQ